MMALRSFLTCLLISVCLLQSLYGQRDSIPNRAKVVLLKPGISLYAGPVISFVRQDKINPAPFIGYCGGVSFKRQTSPQSFILLAFTYQHSSFADLPSQIYDREFQLTVNLTSNASFDKLVFPLLYGYNQKKYALAFGASPSYLLFSDLTQGIKDNYGKNTPYIINKYSVSHSTSSASFYRTNVALSLMASIKFSGYVNLVYLLDYELVTDPIPDFSYLSPYNFIHNKLILTFKIH